MKKTLDKMRGCWYNAQDERSRALPALTPGSRSQGLIWIGSCRMRVVGFGFVRAASLSAFLFVLGGVSDSKERDADQRADS